MFEDQLNSLYLALEYTNDANVKAGLMAQIEELEDLIIDEGELVA